MTFFKIEALWALGSLGSGPSPCVMLHFNFAGEGHIRNWGRPGRKRHMRMTSGRHLAWRSGVALLHVRVMTTCMYSYMYNIEVEFVVIELELPA